MSLATNSCNSFRASFKRNVVDSWRERERKAQFSIVSLSLSFSTHHGDSIILARKYANSKLTYIYKNSSQSPLNISRLGTLQLYINNNKEEAWFKHHTHSS